MTILTLFEERYGKGHFNDKRPKNEGYERQKSTRRQAKDI
jgi:hypothetical protein